MNTSRYMILNKQDIENLQIDVNWYLDKFNAVLIGHPFIYENKER